MYRKLLIIPIIFLAAMFCGIRVSAASSAVYDDIGLLSETSYDNVLRRSESVSDNTGWTVDVYITDCGLTSIYDVRSYARDLYLQNHSESEDGVLFLCDKNWAFLAVFGSCYYDISDERADKIAGLGDEYYSTDPEKSIILVLDGINREYHNIQAEEKSVTVLRIAVSVIFALISGTITYLVIRSSYKTHQVPDTNMYLSRSSLKFNVRTDTFVREYTTRHTSSSHHGGHHGGHHSGGGGHHR